MSADDETRPIPSHDETRATPGPDEETRAMPARPGGAPDETREDGGHIRVVAAGAPAVDVTPAAPPRAGVRVGTLVWGLAIIAVGAWLLAVVWGATIDAELALIVILGIAGVALLAGSLLGMRRSRSRMEGRG